MDYLFGFLVAIFLFCIVNTLQNTKNIFQENKIKNLKYSQSHIHSIVFPLLPKNKIIKKIKKTQSLMHHKKTTLKVIIMDNRAYWIKDNAFYTADMSVDGTVNKDTTRLVDTTTMSKVQLDKMLFIVDRLSEGNLNDSGGSGI